VFPSCPVTAMFMFLFTYTCTSKRNCLYSWSSLACPLLILQLIPVLLLLLPLLIHLTHFSYHLTCLLSQWKFFIHVFIYHFVFIPGGYTMCHPMLDVESVAVSINYKHYYNNTWRGEDRKWNKIIK
jgi:hypothetical protein